MIRSLNAKLLLLLVLHLAGLIACSSSPTSSNSQANSENETLPDSSPASSTAQNSSAMPGSSVDSASTTPARTADEVIEDLDSELDASVAVFDGMILDERGKAEAAASAGGGLDTAGDDGESLDEVLFEEGDLEEGLPGYGEFPETVADTGDNAGDNAGDESSVEPSAGDASESQEGASAPSSTRAGGIPEDIGEGHDDDIVARQIREAAQKEKDPALREKLWDEYRKYKNQQAGG